MHTRRPITPLLLKRGLLGHDLWLRYVLDVTHLVWCLTPGIYLTLSLQGLGFTTFQANLLVLVAGLAGPVYNRPDFPR